MRWAKPVPGATACAAGFAFSDACSTAEGGSRPCVAARSQGAHALSLPADFKTAGGKGYRPERGVFPNTPIRGEP